MKNKKLVYGTSVIGLTAICGGIGLATLQPAEAATSSGITKFSTAFGAVDQTTARGKTVGDLAVTDNNKLVAGYGDYGANTGPIDIYEYDVATAAAVKQVTVPTEEVEDLYNINGKVYAPYTDGRVDWNINTGYATNDSGTWRNFTPAPLVHAFAVASSNGTDRFISGASYDTGKKISYAAVWYSPNGSTGWKLVSRVDDVTTGEWARYYWMKNVNGSVYVQEKSNSSDDGTGSEINANLLKWDANSGQFVDAGVGSIAALDDVYAGRDVASVSKYLVAKSLSSNTGVNVIDPTTGATVKTNLPTPGWFESTPSPVDFFNDSTGQLWYFNSAGILYKTTDGTNWTKVWTNTGDSSVVRSIAVVGNKLFLGTSTAEIDVATIDNATPTPSPTSTSTSASPTSSPTSTSTPTPTNTPTVTPTPTATSTTPSPPVNTAPVLTVPGDTTVQQNATFDPLSGVSATDAQDGTITDKVTVAGSVNTAVAGSYTLTYSVTDSGGLSASKTRVVTVVAPAPAVKPWSSSVSYKSGDVVSYNGATWTAWWANKNMKPGSWFAPWVKN